MATTPWWGGGRGPESSAFTGKEPGNREAKQLAPGHTACEKQSSDSNLGLVAQSPLLPLHKWPLPPLPWTRLTAVKANTQWGVQFSECYSERNLFYTLDLSTHWHIYIWQTLKIIRERLVFSTLFYFSKGWLQPISAFQESSMGWCGKTWVWWEGEDDGQRGDNPAWSLWFAHANWKA